VLDAASPALAAARAARRQNLLLLRRTSDEWARTAHASGAAERAQVVVRRDRLCVPVRAGRQGELPRGSVALAASASGSTVYMEPAPLVPLNNAEAALGAAEAEEEERVLRELSAAVGGQSGALRRLVNAVTALDVAAARARHAAWLGAVEPRFSGPEEAAREGPVRVARALHPLLLQPSLPPPPAPPLPDAAGGPSAPAAGALAGLSVVPELWSRVAPAPATPLPPPGQQRGAKGAAAAPPPPPPPPPPVPVDLLVPPGAAVVAVTGPNTGGKTASLKALGLLALMAKAGLFLPVGPPPAGVRPSQPRLRWFDRVLADLGDGQSLEQSLSTFSGHVRRLRGVLREATPASLVVLDEVGSGTDPGEGAALAGALLLRLAAQAGLTYATTHHSELKGLAEARPEFVNASVEFDLASLRPTYRLLWGRAGESNALAVAEGLGFGAPVVAEARRVAAELRAGRGAGAAAAGRPAALQASLARQAGEARGEAAAAAARRAAAEAEAAAAREALGALEAERAALDRASGEGKAGEEAARRAVARVMGDARAGRLPPHEAEAALRQMERAAGAADAAALTLVGLRSGGGGAGAAAAGGGARWVPRQGEAVRVPKMGGAAGVVTSAGGGAGGGKVSVRVGTMTVALRTADLEPAGDGAGAAGPGGLAAQQERELEELQRDSKGAARAARTWLRADGVLRGGAQAASEGPQIAVAVQTTRNTADVRGMSPDDAASAVEAAVGACRRGDVVFAVHGVGTGRVRAAVLAALRRNPAVAKTEEAEASNGGCTVVYVR
jgi:DNA mismatch repair protein MutS2